MVKRIIQPFEQLKPQSILIITLGWVVCILLFWYANSFGDKHLFPTPSQVWKGLSGLWNEGLVVHIFTSLGLCFKAVVIAMFISLLIAYLSPIPLLKPIATTISTFRFLPLIGLTYYMAVLINDARSMQVSVLVIFMSTYFITSLLSMVRDVSLEEIDHARTLRCNRWEILWEVVIKGRFDMVIDILRQNLAIVWMMLVTVESILVASGGIGVLIKNSDKFANHGRVIALQGIILLVGLGLNYSVNLLRTTIFRYAGK